MAKSRLNSDEIKCAVYTVKFASYVKRTLLIFPRINGPNCSTSKIERIHFIPAGKWITRHARPEFLLSLYKFHQIRGSFLFFLKKNNSTVERSPFIKFSLDTSLRATRGARRLFLGRGCYKLYSKCSEIFMKCNIFSLRNLYKNMRC